MKKKVFLRRFYSLDFSMKVDFRFQTSRVFTMTAKEFEKYNPNKFLGENADFKEEINSSPFGYLVTETVGELEQYDALYEMSANLRPQFLIIYGILSFLTDEIFIPEQCFGQHAFQLEQDKIFDSSSKAVLVTKKQNYSADLEKTLLILSGSSKEKQILLYTLLERWRKALFLIKESEENSAHIDEAVLAYIHIFEVLSDEFKKDLKIEVNEKRKHLISELIIRANGEEQKKNKDIEKIIEELSSNVVTLKPKVMRMLRDLNLLNSKSEAIILRFIGHRNAIAHGRKDLYQDKVVFPLKPFFSFIKDINEDIEVIKIFAAQTICQYIGIERWSEEWEFLLAIEPAPLNIVKDFISNKNFDNLTTKEFIDGKIDGITPYTLYIYYIKKKISFIDFENSLKTVVTNSTLKKVECRALFDVATVLADSKFADLAESAKRIVRKTHTKRWYLYSNVRDVLKESCQLP